MKTIVVQFAVSQAVAEGKCAPQVGIRALPVHESGKPRSRGVCSTVSFKFKDGQEGELMIRDNGNCHRKHQGSELQQATFNRIFTALSKGGVTKPVSCQLNDAPTTQDSLNEIDL
jgi:hypothetical protein